MRDTVGYSAFSNLHSFDLAEFVLSLLRADTVDCKAPLGVIDQAKILASLFYSDNIHKPSGIRSVGPNFAVNLDEALHKDSLSLAIVKSIFQSGRYVSL